MTPRQIGLLAALSAIWGGSYLLIEYALEDFSAPVIVAARTALAALVLAIALRGAIGGALAGRSPAPRLGRPARRRRRRGAVHADHARRLRGPLRPDGGADLAALFVALFAPLIDPSERIDRRQGVGMLIGLGGVALVVGVESIHSLGEFLARSR